jgi:hypothetical protein
MLLKETKERKKEKWRDREVQEHLVLQLWNDENEKAFSHEKRRQEEAF